MFLAEKKREFYWYDQLEPILLENAGIAPQLDLSTVDDPRNIAHVFDHTYNAGLEEEAMEQLNDELEDIPDIPVVESPVVPSARRAESVTPSENVSDNEESMLTTTQRAIASESAKKPSLLRTLFKNPQKRRSGASIGFKRGKSDTSSLPEAIMRVAEITTEQAEKESLRNFEVKSRKMSLLEKELSVRHEEATAKRLAEENRKMELQLEILRMRNGT